MSNYWRKIKTGSQIASVRVSKAYQRLSDHRVCIGVTGFSRSGKTTLLISLLHQLIHHNKINLSAFSPVIQGRLLGAELGVLDGSRANFPYTLGVQRLSGDPPNWPVPTSQESSCLLELRFKPRKSLLKLSSKSFERILVEIRDYPGEWLIDIPMVGMSYPQWCHQWQKLVNASPRKELVKPFLKKINDLNPLATFSESQLNDIYASYHEFNVACREQAGLTLIQPGQLFTQGASDRTIQPFFPLPAIEGIQLEGKDQLPEESWYHHLQQRYNQYVDDYVKPFIEQSVKGIDRQLVLVDVISALSHGPEALADMQQALTQVLETFSYGRNSWLAKLIQPRVERLAVVSTKVDQVLPGQHDNVRRLTSAIVGSAYRKAVFCNIPVSCEAVASIRSSTVRVRQGRERLAGTTIDGTYGEMWHPAIPDALPTAVDWQTLSGWKPRPLLPPQGMHLQQGGKLPHIRLDVLIESLIGDLC